MAHRAESVFVDASGRRRRLIRCVGLVVAVLLAGYLVVVGVGLFVGANMPLAPWPGKGGKAGPGVGAELGRQRGGTPRPTTARPTSATPSVTSPSASVRPGRATTTPVAGSSAATTPPARESRAATPPGRTKSVNPHKPQ